MRFNPVQIMTDGDMSSSLSSNGIDLNQTILYSIQAVWTGTPTGSLKLQISNDDVPVGLTNPSSNVVNWTDYTGSSESVTAAGNFVWNVGEVAHRWVKVVYTSVGGSGTMNIMFSGKGA